MPDVKVADFRIDRQPVTSREIRRFVEATGYVTFADVPPDPKDYPGALPEMLHPVVHGALTDVEA